MFFLLAGRGGQRSLQSLSGWCRGEESRAGQHQEWDHHSDPRDGLPVWPHPQGRKLKYVKSSKTCSFKLKPGWMVEIMHTSHMMCPCFRWPLTGSSFSRPRLCLYLSTTRLCVKMPSCTSLASATSTLSGVYLRMRLDLSVTRWIHPSHKTQGEMSLPLICCLNVVRGV